MLDSSTVIRAGRSKQSVPDFIETVLRVVGALIAAAAIEQGYAVLTGNLRHFEKIPGLRVVAW